MDEQVKKTPVKRGPKPKPKAIYNEKTHQHLVIVNGIERWLTSFQVEIVQRNKNRKVEFPTGSKYIAKPKKKCKDC